VPDHTGRRRRQSNLPIARLLVLVAALAAVVVAIVLPEAARVPAPATPPLTVVPTWSGPAPLRVTGMLADGASYEPRIYLTADTSVGIADSGDGSPVRVILRGRAGRVTELRRLNGGDRPQFDGFAVSGDTLVWAESVSREDSPVSTTLWRTNWRTGARPSLITSKTGDPNFFGGQFDLLVQAGRVYWAAVGAGSTAVTEIRSVPLSGGQVSTKKINGEYALTTWPWAVSVAGGRGTPVELVNMSTNKRIKVPTNAAEISACSPQWCRMAVLGDNALVRIDLQRPDGTDRRRIAGNEATPTVVDVALLDRFVPLKTDRGDEASADGAGLSLYDITSGKTDLVATGVANVQARYGVLWWSTGTGDELMWFAIDLRALS